MNLPLVDLNNATLTRSTADDARVIDRMLSGNDLLELSFDSDRAFGMAGHDTLLGNAQADLLQSGAGNDLLSGRAGTDRLVGMAGGDGADVPIGGAGADRLVGGRAMTGWTEKRGTACCWATWAATGIWAAPETTC